MGSFSTVTYSDATQFDGVIVRASQGTVANGIARSVVINVICSNVTDPYPVFVGEATATLEYSFDFHRPEACGAGCGAFVPPCSSNVKSQMLTCAQNYGHSSSSCGSNTQCACHVLGVYEQCVERTNGGKPCAERDSMLDTIHSMCGSACPSCAGPMPCESYDLKLLGGTIVSLGQCMENVSNADKIKCVEKAAGFIANTTALNQQCYQVASFLHSANETLAYWTKKN